MGIAPMNFSQHTERDNGKGRGKKEREKDRASERASERGRERERERERTEEREKEGKVLHGYTTRTTTRRILDGRIVHVNYRDRDIF